MSSRLVQGACRGVVSMQESLCYHSRSNYATSSKHTRTHTLDDVFQRWEARDRVTVRVWSEGGRFRCVCESTWLMFLEQHKRLNWVIRPHSSYWHTQWKCSVHTLIIGIYHIPGTPFLSVDFMTKFLLCCSCSWWQCIGWCTITVSLHHTSHNIN